MLERLTGKLLSRFLSKYFILPGESDPEYGSSNGIGSPSKTQLAVWSGYLSLQHLGLRSSLVNDHFQKEGLPFELSHGFVDRVEITIPWAQLRGLLSGSGGGGAKNKGETTDTTETEVIVVLDGLYLLLNTKYEFHDEKLKESQKVQRRKELDAAMTFVADGGSSASTSSASYLKSYIKNRLLSETFLNDLFDNMTNRIQIHVRNVHVRLEDMESDPSRPCCFGVTLESLHLTSESEEDESAQSDEYETKKQNKAESLLETLLTRKVMQVHQFSIYCNEMNETQNARTRLEATANYHDSSEFLPLQYMSDESLLRAMHSTIPRRRPRSYDSRNIGPKHTFLLYPADVTSLGVLTKPINVKSGGYTKANLRIETNVTKCQLGLDASMLEHIAVFQKRMKQHKSLLWHRFYRPTVPIRGNCRIWWKYIVRVVQKELCKAGHAKRGRWSWARWYDRVELRKEYVNLYERWLDYGVEGDDAVVVDGNGSLQEFAADKDIAPDNKLTVTEFARMRAIEDATIDDGLTVSDILYFRMAVHSRRQKRSPEGLNSSNKSAINSEYRLTRYLRRMVTSDDIMDEEFARLLSYLERKEEEDAAKRQEQEYKENKRSGPTDMSELSVVLSFKMQLTKGSLKLFSNRGNNKQQICIFDVSLSAVQSKLSLLENFDTVIVESSVLDFVGVEHCEDGLRNVVISRCDTDKLLLPVDLNGSDAMNEHDSPLFRLNLVWRSPATAEVEKYDASLAATIGKISIHLRTGFDWPQRCKEALSLSSSQQIMESVTISSAFWEDLAINWESTKVSLAVKAERVMTKQRKIDIDITIRLPAFSIYDGNGTTLSIDLGHAHLGTEKLVGVNHGLGQSYHNEDTPKIQLNRHSQHSTNSSKLLNDPSKDYLFTPNRKTNGQPSFLSPALPSTSDVDISSILESPFDSASSNGSFSGISESGRRRKRGRSFGNSKLFSVAENEEYSIVVDAGANVNGELLKCFYDYFQLKMGGSMVSISTLEVKATLFEGPRIEAQIAKSIIPADHSLCKFRVTCVVDHIDLNISPDNVRRVASFMEHMKLGAPRNTAARQINGASLIFSNITRQEAVITDDESSIDENEFLDAIDTFQPDTASQWFGHQWMADEESVGETTLGTFARTPSRRYRFPSISEISSGEERRGGYLSAENLSKLDEDAELSLRRRRFGSFSLTSVDDDESFHSAISLDNREELIKAVQEDIQRCEADIDAVKEKIKSAVDMYKDNWRKVSNGDSKRRKHQKRKLKSQLLRLEAELLALNASYREIVIEFPDRIESEPEQQEEGDEMSTVHQRALHRAGSLVMARRMRASSLNLSPTKASGHYSLSLNRDLLFISLTVSSVTLNVWTDTDGTDFLSGKRNMEREVISFLCNQLSLSIHHRLVDTRLKVSLDRAVVVASPAGGTIVQCGYLDDVAVVRQSPIQIDEASFLRVAAEFQKRSKSSTYSKLKLKTNFGPIEVSLQPLVDALPLITPLKEDLKQKQTTHKSQQESTDVMMKVAKSVMGSVSTFEEHQFDIDVQFTSLSISLGNEGTLSLATITGMNLRLARRSSPLLLKTRGQLDLHVSNFQLHDFSRLIPRELIGCQSSFDKLVQARMRLQLSRRENTGGWCVDNGSDDFTAEERTKKDDLVWNIHVASKCQSAIILVLSSDLLQIVDSVKLLTSELKSAVSANSCVVPSEKENNTNEADPKRSPTDDKSHEPSIPVRWRLDYSLLECIIIVPGKHYKAYDSGSHLRLSNSVHVCIQPDLQSGNILIDLSLRSYVVLDTHDAGELNIGEPITVTITALAVPDMLKMEPPNIDVGALDTPCAWGSTNTATTNLSLMDGLDLSVFVETSHLVLNVSLPLFAFIREVKDLMRSKPKSMSSVHAPHNTSTKGDRALSVQAAVPGMTVTIRHATHDDTTHSKTTLRIDMMRVSIASDVHNTTTKVIAGDTVLVYTDTDSIVPVFHTTRLAADGSDDAASDASFLFSATVTKCVDDASKSLEVSLKSGISYFVVVIPFIKQSTCFFESIRGESKDTMTRNESKSVHKNLSITDKLRRLCLHSFNFDVSSCVNLVLPSQDVHSFCKDEKPALNSICLSWEFRLIGVATFKGPGSRDMLMLYQMTSSDFQDLDKQQMTRSKHDVTINAFNHLVNKESSYTNSTLLLLKTDCKAEFSMARSEMILSKQSSGLASIFQTANKQLIVCPFSYHVVTSVVISNVTPSTSEAVHLEDFCSLGFYLDVGDIDITWNIAKSRFGLSDAFTVSIGPLLHKDKKNQLKRHHAPLQEHNLDSVSHEVTSPIQHTASTSNPESTVGKKIKIPESLYLFLSNSIIISSVRIASIQVTCIPSNAKEVLTSPIMKTKLASIRFGTSLLKCPSPGGLAIASERTLDSTISHLYLTCWTDFSLSAHYHNRRLVIWEPFIETWAGNMQGCLNLTEASGMEPFGTEESEANTLKANDTNRLIRFIEGIKDLRRNKSEASGDPQFTEPSSFPTTHCLDLCHFIQTLLIPKCLELAKHPKAASHFTPVHLNEMNHLDHWFLSENDSVSAMLSISNGRADHSEHVSVPLNVNVTGALLDCVVGFSESTTDSQHISPHYISNESGLTMRWKDDSESGQLYPGESGELRLRGFPHRSFISLELFRDMIQPPCFKAVQVNVDAVSVKRYTLKYQEKQDQEKQEPAIYVVVRVQLIGGSKVVSVESPVFIMNSASTPFQIKMKEHGNELWSTTVVPKSSEHVQSATPVPIDLLAKAHEERISWHLSLTEKHSEEPPLSVKVPMSIFKRSQKRGLLGDVELVLPMTSINQNVAVSACFIRVGKSDGDDMHPEQRLLVLRPFNEFRNNLPYPIVFELRISNLKGEETGKRSSSWFNLGQTNSGGSLQFPVARRDETIEIRIKVVDDENHSFPEWSTYVALAPEGNLTPEHCRLTNKNGESILVSVGVEVNLEKKGDSLIEQVSHYKDASRVIFFYVSSILFDYTEQSLEFKSDSTILRHQDSTSNAHEASTLEGRFGLSDNRDNSSFCSKGFAHMIGGKATSLAIRQTGHQHKSPWSRHVSLVSGKTQKRIFVPRLSPISHPLVFCAKISEAPKGFGSGYTKVVTLFNQYTLVNQLPIDIEVISTNKRGKWLKRKPLVVSCNKPPVPFHFDDSGFFRLRPKETGWIYSGLVSITQRRSDIALRLRNKLTRMCLIVTIEFNTNNGPAMSVVIRRSRAVPFRIENFSLLPLQFTQQTGDSELTRKWSDSTILLPYHQAEYAWDEPDSAKRCIDVAVADLDFGEPPIEAASLGHFYLDLIVPGSTVSVPNPQFSAYVTADGPTRVLKITDVSMSMAVENNALPGALPHHLNYNCSICIDIGLSLVDWKPQELVYLYLGDVCLHREVSNGEDTVAVTVRQLSIDCSLWITKYPVLLDVRKGGKSKEAISVSWCKDMNTRGKDITLVRYIDVELGKLVVKVDGAIINFLIQMFKRASKSLHPQTDGDKNALRVRGTNVKELASTDLMQRYQTSQQDAWHITAASAAKNHITQLNMTPQDIDTFVSSDELQSNTPKHKFYIEKIKVSALKAEISYCGALPLPAWLSPAFMFEALPIRFLSYTKGHVYGSINEHMQSIKGHYNIWRFLLGLSLRPMFVVRACIFTTRQSLLTIFSRISMRPSQMLGYIYSRGTDQEGNNNVEETSALYSNQTTSSILTSAASALLQGSNRIFSSLQLLFGLHSELESDIRVRAPRLFARQDDSDVLVEYVQGENTGRVLLSRIRMGIHLFEGYLFNGNIDGFGDDDSSLSADGCFVFILTIERLLILRGSKNMNISSVFWEVELGNITLAKVLESPQDQSISLQIFFMDRKNFGLDMLQSKYLLFTDAATGRQLHSCILSVVTRKR